LKSALKIAGITINQIKTAIAKNTGITGNINPQPETQIEIVIVKNTVMIVHTVKINPQIEMTIATEMGEVTSDRIRAEIMATMSIINAIQETQIIPGQTITTIRDMEEFTSSSIITRLFSDIRKEITIIPEIIFTPIEEELDTML
jgi:hypothetical protein